MGVELRVEIARGLVGEGGDHRLLLPGADHPFAVWILHPGLDGAPLDPGERSLHGPAVGLGDADVTAHQRGQRDGFRRGQREVAAGTVDDLAVLAGTAEARPVRHPALEDRGEDVRID